MPAWTRPRNRRRARPRDHVPASLGHHPPRWGGPRRCCAGSCPPTRPGTPRGGPARPAFEPQPAASGARLRRALQRGHVDGADVSCSSRSATRMACRGPRLTARGRPGRRPREPPVSAPGARLAVAHRQQLARPGRPPERSWRYSWTSVIGHATWRPHGGRTPRSPGRRCEWRSPFHVEAGTAHPAVEVIGPPVAGHGERGEHATKADRPQRARARQCPIVVEPGERRVAQGERPHRVDHDRDGLVLGDRLHPARHRVDRDVGARHEREREDQQRHALGRLGVAGQQADADEQPREGEAVDDAEAEGGEGLADAPWRRKPTRKPMAVVMTRPQVSRAVSASARPASSAGRDTGSERSRSKKPFSTSSATPAAAPMPENSTPVTTKPGTRKST